MKVGYAHAARGIWGSREAQTGCKPTPLLLHQPNKQAHSRASAQVKVHSAARLTAGGDRRRQPQGAAGATRYIPATSSAPAAPLSALLLQQAAKSEPQHAQSLARTSSMQQRGMQHRSEGQMGYLQQPPGDQFPQIPPHQQEELQPSLPGAHQGTFLNPGGLRSFCVRPSASEASSCEPQPRPLPPRLCRGRPLHTRDSNHSSSIDHAAIACQVQEASTVSRHGPACQHSAPLRESRQEPAQEAAVKVHPLPVFGQPAPSNQHPEASTGFHQEAAEHLFHPGSDLDVNVHSMHAANPATTSSLNAPACTGPGPWGMPEAAQTTGCQLMPEQRISDPQQQHVVTSDQATGSINMLGLHEPSHPASQASEISTSKPPSMMGQLVMANTLANGQDGAPPMQACSQDAEASVLAPAAAKQFHAADHQSPHHQHNESGQALKAHRPANVRLSQPHACRLRAYSHMPNQAWMPDDDRLLYVDGSEASDLLLAPFQLEQPAQSFIDQSRRLSGIPDTASAEGCQENLRIVDRRHAISIHQPPREQLLGQDGPVAAEPESIDPMALPRHTAVPCQRGVITTAAMTVASVHAMLSSIQLPSHQHQPPQAQQLADNGPLPPSPAASNGPAGMPPASAEGHMSQGSIPTLMSYAEAVRILSDNWPMHEPQRSYSAADTFKPPETGCNIAQ